MARKKFYVDDNEKQKIKANLWKVALYIRLSREDGDKAESDSITNQKKLLNSYLEEHEEFMSSAFYIDEDFTGTNFKRPAFMRMIKLIEKQEINCVIVKDLSRFGRDYIGAGKYLEHFFPSHNCRFISIIDELDSYINADEISGLMVRIKSLIHDQNSQDISKKVRATKDMQRMEGKYISPFAPFGYKKDPNNKYKLLIDNEAVPIVRNIFDWYLSGMGMIRIAQKLNRLGIMTRADYKRTGSIYKSDGIVSSQKGWRPNAIRRMLKNKTYIGAVDQKRVTTRNYKDRRYIYLDDKDHFIVYDMHEPIIDKSKFYVVQELMDNRCAKTSNTQEKLYIFSGLLRCDECNAPLIRNSTFQKGKRYTYYKCKSYNQRGKNICNHSYSIREDKLYTVVLTILNMHIKSLVDTKAIVEQINKNINSKKLSMDFDRLIKEKKKKIDKTQALKLNGYTDWKLGNVSKNDYVYMRDKLDSIINELNDEITSLNNEKCMEEDIRRNQFKWLDNIINRGYLEKLNREITIKLIDYVYVSQDRQIRIVFKYKDEFNRLKSYIRKHTPNTCYKENVYGHAVQ